MLIECMVDSIDQKILAVLKKDSRTSNTSIAKQVGLTEGAVRARITKMLKQKVIERFTIEANEGKNFAIVMVNAKSSTKDVMRELAKLHISEHAYEISGAYDGCLIIEGESIDAIDEKIDQIRALKSVEDTQTFIVLRKW